MHTILCGIVVGVFLARVVTLLLLTAVLYVRPSVRHTGDSRLGGSRHRNTFCTTRWSDAPSFVRPNFVIVSLGVRPE